MHFIYVFNATKIKKYLFILVALLFASGVIYSQRGSITTFSLNEPSAIYSVVTQDKVLALTFDISWGDVRTEPVLQVLKDHDVQKATFFLSSPWAKSHPDIVKKIVDHGYEIGSHGHEHVNYSSLSDEEIRKQIQTAHTILTDEIGTAPHLIRLPNGDFDQRVLQIANQLNYTVIQWDTDSMDWLDKSVDEIVNRVVTKAHPGDIILMHASDSSKQIHLALPRIIDKLRTEGYTFATVSELINHTEMKNTEVEDRA